MWGSKAHLAQKLIDQNGLDSLRNLFALLLGTDDPEKAYADAVSRVKGVGPAMITEVLAYRFPDRCGIWNRAAREGLGLLGLKDTVNLNKYTLSREEYSRFNKLLSEIAEVMHSCGIPNPNVFTVDFFLYFIVQTERKDTPTAGPKASENDTLADHDELKDFVANIGTMLGFDVSTEVKVAHGAQVDVIWQARIGNLGEIKYVFEVHCKGSIDSLILNLQKASQAPSVQKVVAISDNKQLEQIRRECEGLPESFRRMLRLWPIETVLATYDYFNQAMKLIADLELIEAHAAH